MSFEIFSNVVVYLKSEIDALLSGYSTTAHSHAHAATTGQTADDHHAQEHSHDAGAGDAGKIAQANSHESADTDAGAASLHHTIGAGAAQAAAGNHGHTVRSALMCSLAGATIGSGVTTFICPGTGVVNATSWKTALTFPFTVTLKNLRVYTSGAQPASGSLVFTLWDDSLAQSTGITVTFAAGAAQGAQTDSIHTYNLGWGQALTLKAVNNATAASAPIAQIYLEYDT